MHPQTFPQSCASAAPLYAGSFCRAFLAMMEAAPNYFASSPHMPLKQLANMPKKFYLDLPGADEVMVRFAGAKEDCATVQLVVIRACFREGRAGLQFTDITRFALLKQTSSLLSSWQTHPTTFSRVPPCLWCIAVGR